MLLCCGRKQMVMDVICDIARYICLLDIWYGIVLCLYMLGENRSPDWVSNKEIEVLDGGWNGMLAVQTMIETNDSVIHQTLESVFGSCFPHNGMMNRGFRDLNAVRLSK